MSKKNLGASVQTFPMPVYIVGTYDVKEADYLGIASGAKGNKFDNIDLTPIKSEHIHAPVIQEFPMTLECEFKSETKMGDHYMIIAEITNVLADEDCLTDKGAPDIKKMNPLAFSPAEYDYYAVGEHVGDAFRSGLELMKK